MGNFLPSSSNVDGSTAQNKKDGLVLTKWNADPAFWHCSIKGVHVCGSPHNRPMLVRQGSEEPYVAPLGLSVPIDAPLVQIFSGGEMDGPCQLAMRKFNSKTGCASDFTALWPPAGISTGVTYDAVNRAAININRSADSPVNTYVAQKFTVPDEVATASGGNAPAPVPATSRLTYQSVTVRLQRVGSPIAGEGIKAVIYTLDGSGNPLARTAESQIVDLDDIPTTSWGTDVVFPFVEDLLFTPDTTFWLVLVPVYDGTGAYVQVIADTDSSYGGANSIKLYQSSVWQNYADASAALVFNLDPTVGQRGHFNYADLTGLSVNITNLNTVAVDAVYEDYDCVQVMVASTLTEGEWKILRTVPINTETPSSTDGNFSINQPIENASVLDQPSVLPFFNRQWGGVQQLISFQEGEQQRLIGFGLPGWDNYVDAPISARAFVHDLIRGDGMNDAIPQWVIGDYIDNVWVSGTNLGTPSAFDGYLITIFEMPEEQEAGGVEVMRGILNWNATYSVLEVTNARGQGREYLNTDKLRMEVRRQVLASVTRGSTQVTLYYENGSTPAYVADQWMVNHDIKIQDIDGPSVAVIKCVKKSSTNPVPYVSKKYFPSNVLQLETAWKGVSGSGQLTLVEDRNTIFFGGGRDDEFQGTSPKLWLTLDNTRPVTAIGACKAKLIALTKGTELFKMEVDNIVTPNTVEALAGFGVSSAVTTERMLLNYTCLNWTGTVTDHNGDLYCIGGEAIYRFNGIDMVPITNNVQSDRIKSYGPGTMKYARAVLDPGMRFEPAIRFGGFHIGDEYRQPVPRTDSYLDLYRAIDSGFWGETFEFGPWKDFRYIRNVQMVYLPNRNGWLNFDKQMETASMCTALDDKGRYRVMIGGEGRVWMYGSSSVDGTTLPNSLYTLCNIDGTNPYMTSMPASNFSSTAPYTLSLAASEGFPVGSAFMWTARAGAILYKIADDGSWEKAEILYPTGDAVDPEYQLVTVLLKPQTSWTITEGATYDVIIGAREFGITLPTIVPQNINGSVDWRAFKLIIADSNGEDPFEWTLQVSPWRSDDPGSANVGLQDTYNYTRTDFQENRFQHNIMLDQTVYEFYPRFYGLAPPDSHLTFERLGLIWWEHGG